MPQFLDPTAATGRAEYVGGRLHNVEGLALVASLVGQITREAPGGWWAVVPTANGWLHYRYFRRFLLPPEDQQLFARDLAIMLNREANAGGMWVVAWSKDDQELHHIWRDADGDSNVVWTLEDSWVRIRRTSIEDLIESCVLALYRADIDFIRDLKLTQEQRVKRAQGQRTLLSP